MSQLIRDIQIDLIMGNKNPIIETFNGIWKDLFIMEVDTYHNKGGEFIYYNQNNEWVFFRDDINDKFWCSYGTYWEIIQTKLNIRHSKIPSITKLLVENFSNNIVATPKYQFPWITEAVEFTLNNKISSPEVTNQFVDSIINNVLTNKLSE